MAASIQAVYRLLILFESVDLLPTQSNVKCNCAGRKLPSHRDKRDVNVSRSFHFRLLSFTQDVSGVKFNSL